MKPRCFRNVRTDRAGVSSLEFALIAVPFLMLTFGVIEFGRLIWTRQALEGVAIQGARCMGLLAPACASAGAFSQAGSMSYIQSLASGWGVTLTSAQITLSASSTSGACSGLSEVSINYTFQTVVPGLLTILAGGSALVGHACFPNRS